MEARLARVEDQVLELLQRGGTVDAIGTERIHDMVYDSVADIIPPDDSL